MWTDRRDGPWLYVEQALAERRRRPYRQRVYHLVDRGDGAVSSEVYSFEDPLRFAGDWKKDEPLAGLNPDSLLVREGCAVVLRRTTADTFEGSTVEKECVSNLRGAAYATSEVTVAREQLTSWDRGFEAAGGQVWGAPEGPYIFRKPR